MQHDFSRLLFPAKRKSEKSIKVRAKCFSHKRRLFQTHACLTASCSGCSCHPLPLRAAGGSFDKFRRQLNCCRTSQDFRNNRLMNRRDLRGINTGLSPEICERAVLSRILCINTLSNYFAQIHLQTIGEIVWKMHLESVSCLTPSARERWGGNEGFRRAEK